MQLFDERPQSIAEAALGIACRGIEFERGVSAKDRRRAAGGGVRPLDHAIVRRDLHRCVVHTDVEVEIAQRAIEEPRKVEELSSTERREAPREHELPFLGIGRR